MRTIAVDWSGRTSNPGAAIWLAEVRDGELVRLEGGRDRAELVEHLVAEAERDADLAVGLDFAFSCPAWFVRRYAGSAFEFWNVVAALGEGWLRACEPPFWRAAGSTPLPPERAFRRTDLELRCGPTRPESVFKLVGATQVGPGSIRGMPFLGRLRAAGFGIWPFEDARPPLVVEIWPRALTGPVTKSRRGDRARVLAGFDEIGEPLRGVAASTDDIFDAAASAAVMWRSADRLRALAAEPDYGLEGKIWTS